MKKNRYIIFLLIICLSILLIGCSKKAELSEKIVLNAGAIMDLGDNSLTYLNSDKEGNYSKITSNKEVLTYNLESGKYLYLSEGNIYVREEQEDLKIDDHPIYSYSLSPKGNYLFYFIKDNYLVPKIIDLENNNTSNLNNKVVISGDLIGWISDNKLAYYGVDSDSKKSGIFTFDVSTGKKELLYNVKGGFVTYLKSFGNSIVFLIKDLDGSIQMMQADSEGNISLVSKEVEEIDDVQVSDEGVFLLGKIKNNVYSLYKLSTEGSKRLVFDFPLNISLDKGLTKNSIGEILFIGGNTSKGEKIYKYSDGTISIEYDKEGQYDFISIS